MLTMCHWNSCHKNACVFQEILHIVSLHRGVKHKKIIASCLLLLRLFYQSLPCLKSNLRELAADSSDKTPFEKVIAASVVHSLACKCGNNEYCFCFLSNKNCPPKYLRTYVTLWMITKGTTMKRFIRFQN